MKMDAEIGIDTKGIRLGWKMLAAIAHWGWIVLLAVLGGHIWMTHQSYAAISLEQQKQNMRLDRIERAITACLDRELDCEAQRAERIVK